MHTRILIGLILGIGIGCGEDVGPIETGQLELSWQISPRGCEEAGVENIRVEVDGSLQYREIIACAAGKLRIDDVVASNYTVRLEGLDEVGIARFVSDPQNITVRPNLNTRTELIRLSAKPANIDVGWRFEDGRVCGAHAADSVDVVVFDKLDYEITSKTFSCNDGIGTLEGLMAGTYFIEAVANGEDDFFIGQSSVSVGRGEVGEVEIVLAPRSR